MIVVAGPGQGSQKPGFLTPWLDDPTSASLLATLSEAAEIDLVAHGTTSDADTIRDTAVAQPLIVAAGIITAERLFRDRDKHNVALAGHSVGEITAACVAGVLSAKDAMRFVHARATGMAKAAAKTPTSMAAVLGGEQDDVVAHLAKHNLAPANFNGGGQIVAAGAVQDIEALAADPMPKTRVIPLSVAGAFHTHFMSEAVAPLADFAKTLQPQNPTVPLYTNANGETVAKGSTYLDLLVAQVECPVHWDAVTKAFAPTLEGFIELAPGGTLAGLVKRQVKGVPTVAIKTPEDLPAALELLGA